MPPKLQKNVASKQKNDDIETGNVTSRRSRRNSTKNDEEITSLGKSETNGKGGAFFQLYHLVSELSTKCA
jgi:hypothetical protein